MFETCYGPWVESNFSFMLQREVEANAFLNTYERIGRLNSGGFPVAPSLHFNGLYGPSKNNSPRGLTPSIKLERVKCVTRNRAKT